MAVSGGLWHRFWGYFSQFAVVAFILRSQGID